MNEELGVIELEHSNIVHELEAKQVVMQVWLINERVDRDVDLLDDANAV